MYLSELYNILNINFDYEDILINNIVTNSNEVTKGDIFLCINSGYKYIDKAIKNGCVAIIINEDINVNYDILTIKVKDTIKSLGLIASYIRSKFKGTLIAITGSMGKTTTKELLGHILSKFDKTLISEGSINNHIGIPNLLLKLNNSYKYVVLELGTNHIGEIKYLTDITRPDISIITNIGYSHIGNFETIDNILKEKLNIKYKTLIVNGEDKYLKDVNAIKVYNNDYEYEPYINFYKMNYNLVIKVLELLNYNYEDFKIYLDSFRNISSRMNVISKNNKVIIDDAYNASYDSIMSGLKFIKKYNRQIIVLSEILEIGNYNNMLYKNIFDYIKNNYNDYIVLTIGESLKEYNKLHFDNLNDIANYLNNMNYYEGDVIYIKGSHSYNLSSLIKDIE